MATTAQDCVCCDADMVMAGIHDDTSSTGENAILSIGDNENIDVSFFRENLIMNFT